MSAVVRGARAAFVFLTRLPVGGGPYASEEWAWASAHFPLVGLVTGAALGALDAALRPSGALASASLVIGASMLMTGAMHEDGLADTSDALGGAFDRERLFAILKDSRVGSFGACALGVSIVARVTLLAQLGPAAVWALPLVGCAARVGPVWQMVMLPYVTGTATGGAAGKSRDLARATGRQALVASAWLALAIAVVLAARWTSALRLATLIFTLGAVTWFTAWRYVRRAGGITGDFLGATEQLGEIAAYAVLAWDLGR